MSISEAPGALPATVPVPTDHPPTDHLSTADGPRGDRAAAHQPASAAEPRAARALDASGRTRWADRQPWRDALTSVGLISVALLFLEAVADILPDGTWFWLITPSRAVLLVGLVAMALVAPRPGAWRTWLDAPLALLVVVSLLASFGRTESMALWRWLLTEVGFFYLVVMVRRLHRDTHRAALVLGLTGVATAALVALQQAAQQTPTGFCRAPAAGMADGCEQPGALVRVIGTFANPNLLAAFLLIMLPLAWLAVDEWLNRSMRLAGWAVIALGALALLHTWSRAGIAAGLLGVLAMYILLQPYGRRLRRGGLLLVAGTAGAVLVVLVSGAGIRTRVWAESLRLAAAHPLGTGMGSSGLLLTEALPDTLQFQHAHNTWLNWLIEAGWLGLLAVLGITVLVCWRAWRSSREGSRIAAACGAGLLGVGLMSLADHPANSLRVAMVMAFVIGLLMSSPLADQSIRAELPASLARFVRPGGLVALVRPVGLLDRGRDPQDRRSSRPLADQVPPSPVMPAQVPPLRPARLDPADSTGPQAPVEPWRRGQDPAVGRQDPWAAPRPEAGSDPWASPRPAGHEDTAVGTPEPASPWRSASGSTSSQPSPWRSASGSTSSQPSPWRSASGSTSSQPSPWRSAAPDRVQTGPYDE